MNARPSNNLAADYEAIVARGELAGRILGMAQAVKGKAYSHWPAWSTGERLAVALLLNDADALRQVGFTMVEAFDRLSGELTINEFRAMERHL